MSRFLTLTIAMLVVLILCVSPSADAAQKKALLVGISRYEFIKDPVQGPSVQLNGASNDLMLMGALLKASGFTVKELRGKEALRDPVTTWLKQAVEQSQPGDEITFFFSGRGTTLAANDKNEKLGDTALLLCGSSADSEVLKIQELADFAKAASKRRAHMTVIVDACFYESRGLTRAVEDRNYNEVYRWHKVSDAKPKPLPIDNGGVFLFSTDETGKAYEWDLSLQDWSGAFTTELVTRANHLILTGKRPTYRQILREVRGYFAASKKRGYMPGELPFPDPSAELNREYDEPMFAANPVPPVPQPVKAQVIKIDEDRKQRESCLRVAIDTNPDSFNGPERKRFLAEVMPAIKQHFVANGIKGIDIIPEKAAHPDRNIYISKDDKGYHVNVQGDEKDAEREPNYSGLSMSDAMKEGLADYLEAQAIALRLWRLSEEPGKGMPGAFSAKSNKKQYRIKEKPFFYELSSTVGGRYYLFDQDEDEVVQLILPDYFEIANAISAGELRSVPRLPGAFHSGRAAGANSTRALLVVPPPGMELPSLANPAGGPWYTEQGAKVPNYRHYYKLQRDHLKALLQAIESGKARWASSTFEYEVVR